MSWRRLSVGLLVMTVGLLIIQAQQAIAQQNMITNRGVVEIETGSAAGISVRIVEELPQLVGDGPTRRVLPVVGKGSLQNLTDLRYLRGIDMAILQTDLLDYAKELQLSPELTASLTYVTKLYNEELHLLARADIK